MLRAFGSSVLVAVVIAIALSLMPTADLPPNGEVTVFQREKPTALSEETLVDFLSLHTPPFAYRHVEWNTPQSTLLVEFTVAGSPEKSRVGKEWFRFAREVFQSTNNVEALICRLYNEQGDMLAVLEVDDRLLRMEETAEENAADYLEQYFDFRVSQ